MNRNRLPVYALVKSTGPYTCKPYKVDAENEIIYHVFSRQHPDVAFGYVKGGGRKGNTALPATYWLGSTDGKHWDTRSRTMLEACKGLGEPSTPLTERINMAKEHVSSAGAEALAAIARIQEEARAKLQKQVEGLDEAISTKRAEIKAAEKELDSLLDIRAQITGKPASSGASRGKGGRLTKADKHAYADKLAALKGTHSKSEWAEKIGADPKQMPSIFAAAKAGGTKVKMVGQKAKAVYSINA